MFPPCAWPWPLWSVHTLLPTPYNILKNSELLPPNYTWQCHMVLDHVTEHAGTEAVGLCKQRCSKNVCTMYNLHSSSTTYCPSPPLSSRSSTLEIMILWSTFASVVKCLVHHLHVTFQFQREHKSPHMHFLILTLPHYCQTFLQYVIIYFKSLMTNEMKYIFHQWLSYPYHSLDKTSTY